MTTKYTSSGTAMRSTSMGSCDDAVALHREHQHDGVEQSEQRRGPMRGMKRASYHSSPARADQERRG